MQDIQRKIAEGKVRLDEALDAMTLAQPRERSRLEVAVRACSEELQALHQELNASTSETPDAE